VHGLFSTPSSEQAHSQAMRGRSNPFQIGALQSRESYVEWQLLLQFGEYFQRG
jgi:hypothetical protein